MEKEDLNSKNLKDRIASCAIDLFKTFGPASNPSSSSSSSSSSSQLEFTVIAAIIAERPDGSLLPIAVASGTKSMGSEAILNSVAGTVLKDSHAEVLVRRALIRYFLQCIELLNCKELEPLFSQIDCSNLLIEKFDDHTETDPKVSYRLKSLWKLHMYISDSPCGDASIYSRNKQDGSTLSFTGAKLMNIKVDENINFCNYSSVPTSCVLREDDQMLGCIRFKPGRSDIPERCRSHSYSCSDKLAKWVYVGLQGSLLSHVMEPCYLTSIVVSKDPCACQESQLEALNRAILFRLSSLSHSQPPHMPQIFLTDVNYKCSKCVVESQYLDNQALQANHINSSLERNNESLKRKRESNDDTYSCNDAANPMSSNSKKSNSNSKRCKTNNKPRPFGTSSNWICNIRNLTSKHIGTIERTQAQGGLIIGLTQNDLQKFISCLRSSDSEMFKKFKVDNIISRLSNMSIVKMYFSSNGLSCNTCNFDFHLQAIKLYDELKSSSEKYNETKKLFYNSEFFKNWKLYFTK